MLNIVPWRKSDEMNSLRKEMDDLFDRFLGWDAGVGEHLPVLFTRRGFPKVNVAENHNELTIEAELPGLEEKDFEVQLLGNVLVISGERKWEEQKKEQEFHRVEREYGSFRREIPLPDGLRLKGDDIVADYRKGVLKIRVPKLEPTPPTKIKVKAN